MKSVAPLFLILFFSIAQACESDFRKNDDLRLCAVAINQTSERIFRISINGEGYPGLMGDLDPGKSAIMDYIIKDSIGANFEVVWENSSGVHRQILSKPLDFGQNYDRQLVVEFVDDGSVHTHLRQAPWSSGKQ